MSESVFDVVGIHHSELLHQPLSKLMPIESVVRATKRLGDRTPRLLNPIPLEIEVRGKKKRLDGILHRSGRVLILELEEHIDAEKGYGGFGGFYEAIREVASRIMTAQSLGEVLDLGCQEIRKLTGFSRVLAYKFDDDWNGEVTNESKEPAISSLLHHHFPASDIPKQARDLYTTNWLRIIPNARSKPSKIVPTINPITDLPLDLSLSVLRSVSPVHIEYMRNMGQVASMSISLLKGRKLWGLISCHHPEPHFLKYDVRVACEFIGQMISAQIVAREESTEVDHKLQLKKLYDDLLKDGGGYGSILQSFSSDASSLLGLTDARGAALCINSRTVCVGATPSRDELEDIRQHVVNQGSPLFVTDRIGNLPGRDVTVSSVAAGILAIKLSGIRQPDCIIWFRPERRTQIKWAGDPYDAKSVSSDGRIHPRKSFETWHENVAGRSTKWRQAEIDAADELRRSLLAVQAGPQGLVTVNTDTSGFRDALANALATTAATRQSREPVRIQAGPEIEVGDRSQHSRLLLEGFTEFAVLFLNLSGKVQNWSAGAKRLLGYSKAQVIGYGLELFFSEDQVLRDEHERMLTRAREKGRCEEELWLYRADQTSFWGKLVIALVHDDRGQAIGLSAVIQDVTKEKSAEEELKSTKLTAEAANRAKTDFLANISHEIRTPLGAVLGFSELMTSPKISDEERAKLFAKVRRNGEQLTVLINDLLDIGKAESGKIDVENLSIEIATLLMDVEQLFSLKAAEKGVLLQMHIQGQIPKQIYSDPTRLKQVLINLLSNAIKFTPSGGTVRLICAVESMAHGRQMAFRVSDTGRGMSEAEMEKLFRPFVQADASTTRMYGGTGLGLFLSQRLARALGGDLTIEWTEPGRGTTFLAHFDMGNVIGVPTIDHLPGAPPAPVIAPMNSTDLNGIRVLVVDDSPDNRDLLKNYLRKAGAEVTLATNGQEGIELAQSGSFEVVLMDIQMPVIDGNRAMRMLTEIGYDTPVVALTAHAMKEEREQSLALGFADYLTKPIDRQQLIQRIRELAKRNEQKSRPGGNVGG